MQWEREADACACADLCACALNAVRPFAALTACCAQLEPLLDLCVEHFTTATIDRATDLLLLLLRGDEAQKELYVALNIVNLLIKIIAHCSMNAAKENAVVMLRCE